MLVRSPKEKRLKLKRQSADTYEEWTRYFLYFLEQMEYLKIAAHDSGPENTAEFRAFALEIRNMGNNQLILQYACSGFLILAKSAYKLTRNPISEMSVLV